jgi:hypothetical protein
MLLSATTVATNKKKMTKDLRQSYGDIFSSTSAFQTTQAPMFEPQRAWVGNGGA